MEGFDFDRKAGIGMTMMAINGLPLSQENKVHRKE